jgi:hypothetical protein
MHEILNGQGGVHAGCRQSVKLAPGSRSLVVDQLVWNRYDGAMTNSITLTDDQLHWLRISVENSLEGAKRVVEQGIDDDDVRDGLELIGRFTELQQIIGEPPPIGLPPE